MKASKAYLTQDQITYLVDTLRVRWISRHLQTVNNFEAEDETFQWCDLQHRVRCVVEQGFDNSDLSFLGRQLGRRQQSEYQSVVEQVVESLMHVTNGEHLLECEQGLRLGTNAH